MRIFTLVYSEQLAVEAMYGPHLERQRIEIETMRREERMPLPADIDYKAIPSLSNEVREKLIRFRPATLGMACATVRAARRDRLN